MQGITDGTGQDQDVTSVEPIPIRTSQEEKADRGKKNPKERETLGDLLENDDGEVFLVIESKATQNYDRVTKTIVVKPA